MPEPDVGQDPVRRSLERALGEQYVVLRLLGRGGMGAVYLARDVSLERLVAVKVLPLEKGGDARSRERFRREARTAARLNHPNVVPLHSFGEADGMQYLVMGYVQGESLSARMRRGPPVTVAEARRIGAEIAEALDHAHSRGVVHRDVKPDNVLIDDESGRSLLTDFGVAKAHGAGPTVTHAGAVVGTPAYMSPEQAAGRDDLDTRSDLYSLGAVLYALLSGRPPFGGSAGELLVKHLTQEPVPLRELRPGVPEDLAAAVMRCLAKDREARWPDARRLREAIAPTDLDEEQLPEPLDALDGLVPRLLPFALIALFSLWHVALAHSTGLEPNLLGMILAFVLGGVLVYQVPWLTSALALARRRGFPWRTIAGALFRQPAWWPLFWYPPRFRRSWDVWERLPLPFRVFRGASTASLAVLLANLPIVIGLLVRIDQARAGSGDLPPLPAAVPLLFGTSAFLVLIALGSLPFAARQVLALGYDVYTRRLVASALLSGPTAQRSLWRKPEVSRALLPPRATPAAEVPEPSAPRDYASAIVRADGARAEAESLVAEIAQLDAEVERLAADDDPNELAQQRERLAALGPADDAEGEERRQRRRQLEEQIALAARVQARLEAARARRAERLEFLRSLWRAAVAGGGEAPTPTAPQAAARSGDGRGRE
jgi:hypothetical protein